MELKFTRLGVLVILSSYDGVPVLFTHALTVVWLLAPPWPVASSVSGGFVALAPRSRSGSGHPGICLIPARTFGPIGSCYRHLFNRNSIGMVPTKMDLAG